MSDGVADPVFGLSALLSVLTAADGYVIVPEEATGLDAGTEVEVTVVSLATVMADSPFIRDVPAARALDAWRSARDAARLPGPAAGECGSGSRRRGPGHRRAGVGHPFLAAVRRGGHGRDRGPGRRHPRRERDHAGLPGAAAPTTWSTPATRCPTAATRS